MSVYKQSTIAVDIMSLCVSILGLSQIYIQFFWTLLNLGVVTKPHKFDVFFFVDTGGLLKQVPYYVQFTDVMILNY